MSYFEAGTDVPPPEFFKLITAAYKDKLGPIVITGGTRNERIALAERYADHYSKDIAEYMLWINCSTIAIMSSGFYAIAEAYNFPEAMATRNVYDLMDKVLTHFLPWKALFVLEEADVENKFMKKFFDLAKSGNNTSILVTHKKAVEPGNFSVLNYDLYKTRDFFSMLKGLKSNITEHNDFNDTRLFTYQSLHNVLEKYAAVTNMTQEDILRNMIKEILNINYDILKENNKVDKPVNRSLKQSRNQNEVIKSKTDILNLETSDK